MEDLPLGGIAAKDLPFGRTLDDDDDDDDEQYICAKFHENLIS